MLKIHLHLIVFCSVYKAHTAAYDIIKDSGDEMVNIHLNDPRKDRSNS